MQARLAGPKNAPGLREPRTSAPPSRSSVRTGRVRRSGLSLPQLAGGCGAAITAAFVGSRLGVAGTVIGAGVASVISVAAGQLYSTSLAATGSGMRRFLRGKNPVGGTTPGHPGPLAVAQATASVTKALPSAAPSARRTPAERRRLLTRSAVMVAGAVGVFVLAMALITGIEAASGRTLSGTPSGLSVLGGHSDSARHVPDTTPTGPTTTVGIQTTGAQATGTPATGTETTGTLVTGTLATGTPATGTETTGTETTGTPATGTETTGTPTTGTETTGTETTGTQTTGTQTTGTETTGTQTTGTRTAQTAEGPTAEAPAAEPQ